MEKATFIEHVCKQLEKMSEEQKDAWILSRAKLLSESEQQGFLMSLSGEKIITYMPARSEIESFCKAVQDGDICMEYDYHYYEFSPEGRYVDNWILHYHDPQGAFSFLDRVFRGCRDLERLGEYGQAGQILDQVCRLEFQVVKAADSEEFEKELSFLIADAEEEHLLSMKTREIGFDWIMALLLGKGDDGSVKCAEKLVDVLNSELCKESQISDFSYLISDQLLIAMEKLIKARIKTLEEERKKVTGEEIKSWRIIQKLETKIARNQHLLLDIQKKCKKQEDRKKENNKVSVLKASWNQINELFRMLSYERYIDDQLEIDEVWNICQALIKRNQFEEEDWNLRKKILNEMAANEYYDCYGCYDPIKELSEKLYITEAETLEYADILDKYGYTAREAANLYRQYGRMEKYVRYLETHLGKTSKEYVELIQCYSDDGNKAKAREVAEAGVQKCKDDLTELFIFLLKDARECGMEDRYKKFYASAKRRMRVDMKQVDHSLQL